MVPLGPRLVFKTSCNPLPALMFTPKAYAFLKMSALAFTIYKELIFFKYLNIY